MTSVMKAITVTEPDLGVDGMTLTEIEYPHPPRTTSSCGFTPPGSRPAN